jgi:hypothetical protein
LLSKAKTGFSYAALVLVVGVDFFIQTQLTAPTTIHHGISYAQTDSYFDSLEQLPNHDQRFNSTAFNDLDESRDLLRTDGLERNVSTFNHTVSAEGENPMRFKAFDRAKESGKLDWILANPLFYVPTHVADASDTVVAGCVFGVPFNLNEIGDSCSIEEPLVDFNAYRVRVANASSQPRWLVLNANYHHLWSAKLNDEAIPISPVNEMVMGVLIPPRAAGMVQFEYASPYLQWAWGISVMTLLSSFAVLLLHRRRGRTALQ